MAENASIHAKYELQEGRERTIEKKKARLFLEVAQGSEHVAFPLATMKRQHHGAAGGVLRWV